MRFSKAALQQYIQGRIDNIQKRYGFDPDKGTVQLEHIARHIGIDITEVTWQYGAWLELHYTASVFGLQVSRIGSHNWQPVYITGGFTHYKYVGEHEKT